MQKFSMSVEQDIWKKHELQWNHSICKKTESIDLHHKHTVSFITEPSERSAAATLSLFCECVSPRRELSKKI